MKLKYLSYQLKNWIGFSNCSIFKVLTFIGICCIWSKSGAQLSKADSIFLNRDDIETIETVSVLDPNKALILSAALPGLGQAYNNQYWKIPIIYGGGIIIGHYIRYNHEIYHEFRNALIAEVDGNDLTVNPYEFSTEAIKRQRDAFRRNRDLLILIAGAFYVLNIVDANVSAHLNEFDVNEKLSLKVSPSIESTPLFSQAVGISLSLSFK